MRCAFFVRQFPAETDCATSCDRGGEWSANVFRFYFHFSLMQMGMFCIWPRPTPHRTQSIDSSICDMMCIVQAFFPLCFHFTELTLILKMFFSAAIQSQSLCLLLLTFLNSFASIILYEDVSSTCDIYQFLFAHASVSRDDEWRVEEGAKRNNGTNDRKIARVLLCEC